MLSVKDRVLKWFDLKRSVELLPGPGGVLRSQVFPGLWVDPAAVFAKDATRVCDVLDEGLRSPEYACRRERAEGGGHGQGCRGMIR